MDQPFLVRVSRKGIIYLINVSAISFINIQGRTVNFGSEDNSLDFNEKEFGIVLQKIARWLRVEE
jgi:hypothetical protein